MGSTHGIRSEEPDTPAADPGVPGAPPAPGDWPPGWTVLGVAETGSTNADLLRLSLPEAALDGRDRIALVADHQTAGRGRLDRRWEAPPGANLLVSLLIAVPADSVDAGAPHRITQRVALAAALACDRLAPSGAVPPVLKWPNDLLLGGAKLAGILAETGGRLDRVVVGLGLNVGWAPDGAACLAAAWGPPAPTRDAVLGAVLAAYDELDADPDGLHARYRERLGTIGQQVRADLPDGSTVTGRALAVEPDGRLVVLDACGVTNRVGAGDVVHLRPV